MPNPRHESRDEEKARLSACCACEWHWLGRKVEFCVRFGFTVPQWSNYENGRPIGKAAALKLVSKIHGLTLDWIYLGNSSGLTMEMAKRLGVLPPDGKA